MVLDRLDTNTSLYTYPEIDYCINESVRLIALFTGFYRNTTTATTVANKLEYTTPTGMLVPVIISFNGRQLQKTSFHKLVRMRRNWATATTASLGRVDMWAPIGVGTYVMSPIDAVGGNTLTITGLNEPPLLVNQGDTIVLENEYVELITAYGAHRLPIKEGGKVFADGSLEINEFHSKLKERMRYESFKAPKYSLVRQGVELASSVP
jgi:hypothetical protein